MRDLLSTLQCWRRQGQTFALATVVRTWGSSPRQVGSCMAVSDAGEVVGSVSAGCVEGVVIEAARRALISREPEFLQFEAISNEVAWEVGLSCGGELEVWVEPEPKEWPELESALLEERPTARVVHRDPYSTELHLGAELPDSKLENGRFVHVFRPQPRLIILGAGHLSIALVKLAKALDFRVIVLDPRSFFSNPARFAVAPDLLLTQYPHEFLSKTELNRDTYAVALSHDPKIDEPALTLLLKSNARYVGALGSKVTQQKRREALLELGVSQEQLQRLRGPVGLNIGAKTPEEIAVSILAEIIQVRHA